MKRLAYLFIAALAAWLSAAGVSAQSAYRTFYIYRNDGQVNAFFFHLVDSMTVSPIDADSLEHDVPVMQEVWTQDSVFRIPLASIDSIGYQTPPNIYAADATPVSADLRQYILSADSTTLYLSTATPASLIPAVGAKLATSQHDARLPLGFMGQVRAIERTDEHIALRCDRLMVEDVYEQFYGTFEATNDSAALARRRLDLDLGPNVSTPLRLGEITFSNNWEAGLDLGNLFNFGIKKTFGYKCTLGFPETYMAGCLIMRKDLGNHFSMTISGKLKADFEVRNGSKIEFSVDLGKEIPVASAYIVDLYIKGGITLGLSGEVDFGTSISATRRYGITFNIDGQQTGNLPTKLVVAKPDIEFVPYFASGTLTSRVGAFIEIGVAPLCSEIAKAALRYESGVELSASMRFGTDDVAKFCQGSSFYDVARDMFEWKITPYRSFSALATLFSAIGAKHELSLEYDQPWLEARLLPTFSNLSYKDYNKGAALDLGADVSGNVFPAIAVGFSVLDDLDQEVFSDYFPENYLRALAWERFDHYELQMPADHFYVNRDYKVYPIVKLFNHEPFKMLASPSTDLRLEVTPQTDEPADIAADQATLCGHFEGFTNYLSDAARTGFVYGTTEEVDGSNGTTVYAQYDDNYQLTKTLTGLSGGTTYYYRTFLRDGGTDVLSTDVQHFTTPVPVKLNLKTNSATYDYNQAEQQHELNYNVTIRAQLESSTNVEDWGYVVLDDNDSIVQTVPLGQYGRTAIDAKQNFTRPADGSMLRLKGFATYNGEQRTGNVKEYRLNYPQGTGIQLTSCSIVGQATDVSYKGSHYDFCTTVRFEFSATGAYWLRGSVGTIQEGDGWSNWSNLPDELMSPVDGSNAVTVNYYYDAKTFQGSYRVRLGGTDAATGQPCTSPQVAVFGHDANHLTTITLQ